MECGRRSDSHNVICTQQYLSHHLFSRWKTSSATSSFPAAALRGLIWANLIMPDPLPKAFEQSAQLTPAPLWAAYGEPVSEGTSERWSLINLPNVQAPYPQMHDLANEAFDALRGRVQGEV